VTDVDIVALRLVHAAPDVVLRLVGEVSGTMVARLAAIARADIVTLLLAPVADVRQNDRVEVALGAPAVGGGWGVTRVIAARAWGASAGIFLVTDVDIVALRLVHAAPDVVLSLVG
jgi:hypothetical protein